MNPSEPIFEDYQLFIYLLIINYWRLLLIQLIHTHTHIYMRKLPIYIYESMYVLAECFFQGISPFYLSYPTYKPRLLHRIFYYPFNVYGTTSGTMSLIFELVIATSLLFVFYLTLLEAD